MEEEYKMPPQYTEKQDKYKKRTNADFIVKSGIFIFLAALGILGAMITLFVISRGIPYELVVNYMWIFWLWIPLPIMSVIFGIKQGKKAVLNTITGVVVTVIMLLFGAFSFLPSIEPDYETIFRYESIMKVSLPQEGQLNEFKSDTYFSEFITDITKTDVYFKQADELEVEIAESEFWILDSELRKTDLYNHLPRQMMNRENVRYLIYNGTTEEYNCLPQTKGKYRMYVMMFDGLKNHLEINEYDYVYIK